MPAAGPFGVVHVDRAPGDGGHHVLEESGLVQRVGMKLDLEVQVIGNTKAGVDHGRGGTVILVNLHAQNTRSDVFGDAGTVMGAAASKKTEVHGKGLGSLQHVSRGPAAT